MSIAALTKSSRILVFGDSLSSGFDSGGVRSFSWTDGYLPSVRSTFVPDSRLLLAGWRRWPRAAVSGTAGAKAGDFTGTIAATLAAMRITITHIFWQFGINDAAAIAAATLTLGQFQTNATALVTAGQTAFPGCSQIWCGPWAHDSGDLATQIGQIDGVMPAIMAALTNPGAYIKWSLVTNGGGNSLADGTHPTLQGAQALAVPVLAAVPMTP